MKNVLTKGRHKVLPALGQFPGTGLSLNRVSWDNGEVGKEEVDEGTTRSSAGEKERIT